MIALCFISDFKLRSYNFFQIKQCQLINEIKPTFYRFDNVISLTYVFYLILHLVYKFLYLYHILSYVVVSELSLFYMY